MWKSDLAVWLLVWPGVALSAALLVWNVCAGVKEARAWLAQRAYERAVKVGRLANAGRLAQLGALALLLTGCGETGGTPLACGMGALLIITSLIGGEETAEAQRPEEGAEDMQTNAAEGTPAGRPRSITISHTPGQGITLHIDEGMRAAIADSVERDVKFFTNYAADVVKALAESKDAPVVKQAIMDAVRQVVMGAAARDYRAPSTEDVLKHYEVLLREEQEQLVLAEAAMQGPEELRPRPEDVEVMRAEVAHLQARMAQLKADQLQESKAPSAPTDEPAAESAKEAPAREDGTPAEKIARAEAALEGLRADLVAAEASWNRPEAFRASYEEINSLRESIRRSEEFLASLKAADNSAAPAGEPAAPASELPTDLTSAQPA